ncbi:MAG: DUF5666 domain-containing protein [Pseudomonadota bacterium]
MAGIDRRRVMASVGLAALGAFAAGCAPGSGGGSAGTPAGDDQLAERRKPRPPRAGGIGGTGIVGTVTALGSIVINGLRIELDDRTVVSDAFGPRRVEALGPGLSLTVEAERETSDGPLIARTVQLSHPVIGQAAAEGPTGLSVAGVPVRLLPGVGAPRPDARVAVNGLWEGDTVVASRLDPAPGAADVLAGAVDVVAGQVQGRQVSGPAARFLPAPVAYVTLIGRAVPGGFEATSLVSGRFAGGITQLEQLVVEGYLRPVEGVPGVAISGLGHSMDAGVRLAGFDGRTLLAGPYTGLFEPGLGVSLPEAAGERRDLLVPGLDLARAPGGRPTR